MSPCLDWNAPPMCKSGSLPALMTFCLSPKTPTSANFAPCAPYPYGVQIFAADYTLPTRESIPLDAMTLIQPNINLGGGLVNLATEYEAAFGSPPLGSKICLAVVAVTDEGFRGVPLMVTAVVGVGSAA